MHINIDPRKIYFWLRHWSHFKVVQEIVSKLPWNGDLIGIDHQIIKSERIKIILLDNLIKKNLYIHRLFY